MATVVLSAAGAALGGTIGGSFLGVSSVAIGRAVGATLGRVIDQKLMGSGSQAVETGRIDRFRLQGASEGTAVSQLYGRARLSGQVIWATDFLESKSVTGGDTGSGKGGGGSATPETTTYSYSISFAVAICEGKISGVTRVWADGELIDPKSLNMRVYRGTRSQDPDPKIAAVQGEGRTPAYRGIAYVVIEDLDLTAFGNRVPQLSFEVSRPSDGYLGDGRDDIYQSVEAVALMPGTGEYSLATERVYYDNGFGDTSAANLNSYESRPDFLVGLDDLHKQAPNAGSVSLIVSWFGDDLRCAECTLKPGVENAEIDAPEMPWSVSGVNRGSAYQVPYVDGRPVYGGTPTDQSVVQAIRRLNETNTKVMFYPFILMTQLEGNARLNPLNPFEEQPKLPWRGRITLSRAPGVNGSPDGTAVAADQVETFFGAAGRNDFQIDGDTVRYVGPVDNGYRRFILHYAHLCALAGNVDAFCIGSEMRGLTQIRGANNRFEAVERLKVLAADCRAILGSAVKISYAADWSEYFGYHPQDGTGDVFFHLDELWGDPNIDFIGIDNYMPLSDWRDGLEHLDANGVNAIYDLDYLKSNIEGGEGFDWYYHSAQARDAQLRTPIEDGAYDEPWVFRYKDLNGWWSHAHYDRIGGVRQPNKTAWSPRSKPIWFTELGCAAIDKGTNQPNKFLDPKSSESQVPYFSNGRQDPLVQLQYIRAMFGYWNDPANNPASEKYSGRMLDMSRAHVWAWDSRPYPDFPQRRRIWSDGANYARGHWITGRATGRGLADVVAEICERSGLRNYDVSQLFGFVHGYHVPNVTTARSALQPLMLAYGFDAVERNGVLRFFNRVGRAGEVLVADELVFVGDDASVLKRERSASAETTGRVQLTYVDNDREFEAATAHAVFPDEQTFAVSETELELGFTAGEARDITERWLAEARIARETAQFVLPPSKSYLGVGDVVALPEAGGTSLFRIDRAEDAQTRSVEAVRIETESYAGAEDVIEDDEEAADTDTQASILPVHAVFMDLPLLTGDEIEHAPHVASTASSWPGGVAVYRSATGHNFSLNTVLTEPAVLGPTLNSLGAGPLGVIDRSNTFRVSLTHGALESVTDEAFLAGANAAVIGDGTAENWEIIQFQTATLISENTYVLSDLLRGQGGSDIEANNVWPEGSTFVLLGAATPQMQLESGARGVLQHLRYGPASRALTDDTYRAVQHSFAGIGLRPLRPVHAKVTEQASGLRVSWIRRTRIEGDLWADVDVPLGEAEERYRVELWHNSELVRTIEVGAENYDYTASEQVADGINGPVEFKVAQYSDRFGYGPSATVKWGE